MHRTQTFYDVPVNPFRLLDENELVNMEKRPVYRVSRDLKITGDIRDRIECIIFMNMARSMNFEKLGDMVRIAKNGYMYHRNGGISAGGSIIYISLKPGKKPIWGCTAVDKIAFRTENGSSLDSNNSFSGLIGSYNPPI